MQYKYKIRNGDYKSSGVIDKDALKNILLFAPESSWIEHIETMSERRTGDCFGCEINLKARTILLENNSDKELLAKLNYLRYKLME